MARNNMTLQTFARVHGFKSTDEAATFLDLPHDVHRLSMVEGCSACPADQDHEPVWLPGEV